MDDAYLKILQMIESGSISADEGERLLDALEAEPDTTTIAPAEVLPAEPPTPPAGPPRSWQFLWVYPTIGGLLLLAGMGILTANLVQGGQALGWLACTIPLMLLGTLVAVLAWWSRTARWLHLSVRGPENNIRISLPLPLRLTAWVLRFLRPWIPPLRDTAVDEVIFALAEVDISEGPLSVEVDDEEEGEEVRVYIG
jgi:hypothetical protein